MEDRSAPEPGQIPMVQYPRPAMPGTLYVVATPIGNLDDITFRAVQTLKNASLIAAEDTRRTGTLLRHFGIGTPTTSLHEHNERQKLPELIRELKNGRNIALVSDAGTPVVADPGQRLVAAAIAESIIVVPVPGPSAVLAAVSASGYVSDSFWFAGFVPSRSVDRTKFLERISKHSETVVLFEAPHRIRRTLLALADILGERPITICRELTKLHEEITRTDCRQAATLNILERGEFVLVVGPKNLPARGDEVVDDSVVANYFYHLTKTARLERRPALAQTARHFGLSTKVVYAAVERAKRSSAS